MDNCFETIGYFEEYMDKRTSKLLGNMFHNEMPPNRELGYRGRKTITISEDIELLKGGKTVVVKATNKKPIEIVTMLHVMSGKVIK